MPVRELFAAIDLGAHSLRMSVAELRAADYRILETLRVGVDCGRDTFRDGKIGNTTLKGLVAALRNFRAKLDEYGVDRYRAVATSALREAANRDVVVDRLGTLTGIRLDVIEGSEEARLVDQLVQSRVAGRPGFVRGTSLLVALGAGSCQIAVRSGGEVICSETHPLGTLRMHEVSHEAGAGEGAVVEAFVDRVADSLRRVYELTSTDAVFVIHEELPPLLTKVARARTKDGLLSVPRRRLQALAHEAAASRPDELAASWGLRFDEAETLALSLMLVNAFLDLTKARSVSFPLATLVEAIVHDEHQAVTGQRAGTGWLDTAEGAALALGEKYNFDRPHARQVRRLAMKLFDALADFCGIDEEARHILSLAAVLHDIGTYVSPRGHHKHSAYLIEHSEIMGLTPRTVRLVAQVARYHRRSPPRPQHLDFQGLRAEDQLLVKKLAALLRIADGLDRDHAQRVHHLRAEVDGDDLTIRCSWDGEGDPAEGVWALRRKVDLFEELYGVRVTVSRLAEEPDDEDER